MPPSDQLDPSREIGDVLSRNPFRFAGSVGRFGKNRRDDLIKAQVLLGNAGYYDLKGLGAPTGWPGGEIERGIRRFQKDHDLPVDGIMLPLDESGVGANGEGETIAALQGKLGSALDGYDAPTPEEADAHYEERARRLAHGEEEPAGSPISEIVVAGEDGTAEHPLGVIPPRSAPGPAAPPGITVTDVDGASEPQWRDGAQMARGTITQPAQRPAPRPEPPRPIPPSPGPWAPGPNAAPRQPELRQGPVAPPAARQTRPVTREQEQQFRNLLREQERERLDFRKNPLDRDPQQHRDAKPALPPLRQGRIVIAEDGKDVYVPPLDSWANDLSDERRGTAEAINEALHVILSAEDGQRRQPGQCMDAGGDQHPHTILPERL